MSEQLDKLNNSIEQARQYPYKSIVLAEFKGIACPLCRLISAQLDKMLDNLPDKTKEKITRVSLDVQSYPQDAIEYNITSIPTIMLFITDSGVEGNSARFEKPINIPAIKNRLIKEIH